MRQRKAVIIDEITYDVGPINPTKSALLLTKITKILGPSLVKIFKDFSSGKNKSLSDMDLGELNLDAVFTEFFDRLEEDQLMKVMLTILSQTMHNGGNGKTGLGVIDNESKFDLIFHDTGIIHAFKVVKEAFGVTFSDFFDGNGGFLSKVKNRASETLRSM